LASEADAGYLRRENAAARAQFIGDIPMHHRGAELWVDASLAHRARWLLKLGAVSDAEMEYFATGKLPNPTGEIK
jgi:hypothetical protein